MQTCWQVLNRGAGCHSTNNCFGQWIAGNLGDDSTWQIGVPSPPSFLHEKPLVFSPLLHFTPPLVSRFAHTSIAPRREQRSLVCGYRAYMCVLSATTILPTNHPPLLGGKSPLRAASTIVVLLSLPFPSFASLSPRHLHSLLFRPLLFLPSSASIGSVRGIHAAETSSGALPC